MVVEGGCAAPSSVRGATSYLLWGCDFLSLLIVDMVGGNRCADRSPWAGVASQGGGWGGEIGLMLRST